MLPHGASDRGPRNVRPRHSPIGRAQTVNVPGGLPTHVNATYQEPGLGGWTPDTTGTAQATSGSGAVTQTATAGTSDSDALETLYQQSWGYAAAQNAEALGVNPSALAATCVVESGCQNLYTAGNGSTITGAFQMSNGTYSQTLEEALAAAPSLASSITSGTAGQQDPATQAVAAAQYLKDAATRLQHSGISNPTALMPAPIITLARTQVLKSRRPTTAASCRPTYRARRCRGTISVQPPRSANGARRSQQKWAVLRPVRS